MKRVMMLIMVLIMIVGMVGCDKKEIEEFPKPSSIDLDVYNASLDMYIYMFDVIYNDKKFDMDKFKEVRIPFDELVDNDEGLSKNDIILQTHMLTLSSYIIRWDTGKITKNKVKQKEALRKFKIAEGSLIEFLKDCQ